VTDQRFLTYDLDDVGVATITFDRPDQLNAMSASMGSEFRRLLDEVDDDPRVRVLILTGNGRAFCAGADLSAGADAFAPVAAGDAPGPTPARDWGGILVLRLFTLNKPVIAAINGASVGVGATLTLPCDIRLASTKATFGFVFTRRGIVTDGCASWFLPRAVGIGKALTWCLTGRLLSAEDAHTAGLVESVHQPEDLLPAARALATEIATQTSAVSVALTRRLLWQGLVEDHPMGSHRFESQLIGFTSAGADAREGVASFMDKRAASFDGRVPGDLPESWPLWTDPPFAAGPQTPTAVS